MNIYSKPLQLSLFFHGIILFVLVNLNMSPVNRQDILVIDFSMGNEPISRESARTDAVSRPIGPQQNIKNRYQLAAEQHKKNAEPVPGTTPETSISRDSLQNEPQRLSMTINDNNPELKKGLNEFALYGSPARTGESGSQQVDSSSSSSINIRTTKPSEHSHYVKAHFAYIKDLIHKHIIYPAQAKQMGWEGKVITSFIVSGEGYAKDVKISKSSGYPVLDENAIKAIINASPFPKPPVEAQIIIPILYRLN